MLVLWLMLVLSARCSGTDEIPLKRAELSRTMSSFNAANAIDGDIASYASTNSEDPSWLRVYFMSHSDVGMVVIEKGHRGSDSCVFTVSVYDGEVETVCGTFPGGKRGDYYNETVQCGGKGGDSVRLEQTGCSQYLAVHEIKVFGQLQGKS